MVLLESSKVNENFELQDFDLPNALGSKFSSKNLSKDIVLVAFICNHCPYVHKIIKDFTKLAKKWEGKVETIAISANDPDYTEEDSFDNMAIFAQDHNFTFPYLFDESQEIAKTYGAVCTPDLFVFKKIQGKYMHCYSGRLEDIDQVYTQLCKSDTLSLEQKVSIGCSIKWKNRS